MDLTALPAMAALGLLVFHLVRAFEEVSRIRQDPTVVVSRGDARRKELLRRKRRRLEDMRDVEFDYTAGKLDAKDRDSLTTELKGRVVALMKEVDVIDNVEGRGAKIEAELAERMGRPVA